MRIGTVGYQSTGQAHNHIPNVAGDVRNQAVLHTRVESADSGRWVTIRQE